MRGFVLFEDGKIANKKEEVADKDLIIWILTQNIADAELKILDMKEEKTQAKKDFTALKKELKKLEDEKLSLIHI